MPGCGVQAPSLTSMQIHFEAKHPSLSWEENKDKCIDAHEAAGGVTVAGVAVRGSKKK